MIASQLPGAGPIYTLDVTKARIFPNYYSVKLQKQCKKPLLKEHVTTAQQNQSQTLVQKHFLYMYSEGHGLGLCERPLLKYEIELPCEIIQWI
jgi:hypothetical protein